MVTAFQDYSDNRQRDNILKDINTNSRKLQNYKSDNTKGVNDKRLLGINLVFFFMLYTYIRYILMFVFTPLLK